MLTRLLMCVALIAAVACTRTTPKTEADNNPPVKIKSTTAEGLVTIDRAQLTKELVWSTWLERVDSSIYPGLQPGFPGLSQLIFLELSNDGKTIHMFEKKERAQDPRAANLLDRFPVISGNSDEITFDFSQGLNRRFFKSFIDSKNQFRFQYTYTNVYNFENREGVVTFSQLMKLNDEKSSTLIVHHALRPFEDQSGFETVKVVRPDQLGLMPALFTDATTDQPVAIRRWDIRKPIEIYISSNTPLKYRDAIASGLEWWNRAFGYKVLKFAYARTPLNWGDARINILQWSDDPTFCGGAAAIGPSEANPITGQIYSGKIMFCGSSFAPIIDAAYAEGTVDKEAIMQKVLAWGAAHEMGHVLGFTHNFKGKLYRDPSHPEVLSSTVMDYPVPSEVTTFTGVGPADKDKLTVAYLNPGNEEAVTNLRAYAICSDDEAAYAADCTRFVPGGLTVAELANRYLELLRSGKPFPTIEHAVRAVIQKQFFTVGDTEAIAWMKELIETYPRDKDLLVDELASTGESARVAFALLPWDKQADVLNLLAESALSEKAGLSLKARKQLAATIASVQTVPAEEALSRMSKDIDVTIASETDPGKLTDLNKLRSYVEKLMRGFWEQKAPQ